MRDWVATGAAPRPSARPRTIASRRCSRSSPAAARSPAATTLDELGLSSLERVELMVALEDRFGSDDRRGGVRRRGRRRRPRAASCSSRPPTTEEAGRARRLPVVEPRAGRRASLRRVEPADVDPAAGAVFALDRGRWAGAPGRHRGPGDLRRQSPEPHGHAGDSLGAARRAGGTASRWRWRRSSSRRTSSLSEYHAAPAAHQQPELLPGVALLQRVPAPAARGRRAADAALHRRAGHRRLVGADLPGGQADDDRRDQPRSGPASG